MRVSAMLIYDIYIYDDDDIHCAQSHFTFTSVLRTRVKLDVIEEVLKDGADNEEVYFIDAEVSMNDALTSCPPFFFFFSTEKSFSTKKMRCLL